MILYIRMSGNRLSRILWISAIYPISLTVICMLSTGSRSVSLLIFIIYLVISTSITCPSRPSISTSVLSLINISLSFALSLIVISMLWIWLYVWVSELVILVPFKIWTCIIIIIKFFLIGIIWRSSKNIALMSDRSSNS